MESVIKLIDSEWAVISSAPTTITILIVLIFGVVYWIFNERLKSARELISLRDKQIEDFKSDTGSSSLEEASQRINVLERRFQELDDIDLVAIYEDAKLDIGKLPKLP